MKLNEFNQLVGQNSYIRCVGKERIDPAIVSLESANNHLYSGGTIGWWVRTGYIVVDIDEGKEQALEVIKRLGLKTLICETVKGVHIYFKTNKDYPQRVGMITPFGLKCDFRCANKGYVLLPYNTDNKRKFNSVSEIAELPLEFTPIINRKDSLLGLKEGDGRNATLFAHLMAYKHKGANEAQIETMAKVINEVVFAKAMDGKELDKIVENTKKYEAQTDEDNPYLIYRVTKTKDGEEIKIPSNVNHRAVNDYFVNRGDIFVLGGECFQYQDGVYVEASSSVRNSIKEMIAVDTLITQARIVECYKLLVDDIRIQKNASDLNKDSNLINFKNGVWSITEKKLLPHDSKYLQTIQVPHDVGKMIPFNKTKLHNYLYNICELKDDDVEMLMSYMAYSITTSYGLKTFLALLGPSNSGKSVLIRFFETLAGKQNTSALSIHELNMRFYPSQLYNRLLNSCADNEATALSNIGNLKKITGGDLIMHEKKGKEPFFFVPFAKLIFSFNQMPLQLEEKSNAFYKRMRILGMSKELYLDDAYVKDLMRSVPEVIPYLLSKLPLEEIPRSVSSINKVETLRQDSDSLHAFLSKRCVQSEDEYISKQDFYDRYMIFCLSSGREPHKKHSLMRHMRSIGYEDVRHPQTRESCWRGLDWKKTKVKQP